MTARPTGHPDDKTEGGCYCLCGGMLKFRIRGRNARTDAEKLTAIFWRMHDPKKSPGCGRATAQQAAAARKRGDH